MSYYEYRVVPAPKSLPKVKGVKGPEGRFAFSMAEALNAEGREGWEFQRSETIQADIRKGLFSKRRTTELTVLVFRRWVETDETQDFVSDPTSVSMGHAQHPAPETGAYATSYPTPERAGSTDPADTDADRPFVSARRDQPHREVPPLQGPARD